ncbi:sigma-70 family RNA polymerase sigma factor [Streptomyces ossamyceticus]|nr:sigma-70 family RNA polymerase sigma factor [Streptomyces ossamyceticus]
MTPSLSRRPGGGPPAGKPGRKLGPIAEGVGAAHPGLTISELSCRSGWAKSKISELLRGTGRYPRWEITYGLLDVLDVPSWPMRRLWMAAALEAEKKPDWIDGCIQNRPQPPGRATVSTGPAVPPLEHQAFTELNRSAYLAYARLFLGEDEAREVVAETFDVLWFRWDEALASSDVVPFAWSVLRRGVMARARHVDGWSAAEALRRRGRRGHRDPASYTEVRAQLPRLADVLRDMNTLSPDLHRASEFSQTFEAVVTRLSS